MTNQQHPITPPPELVRQWRIQIEYCSTRASRETLLAQIFAAGADQELEACINYFHEYDTSWGEDSDLIAGLRAARRPPAVPETIEVDGHTYRLVK